MGTNEAEPIRLEYDRGTIVLHGDGIGPDWPGVAWDGRIPAWRAPGRFYRPIVEELRRRGWSYVDQARSWPAESSGWRRRDSRTPRDYQVAAVEEWCRHGRGVVVLPTGTGKTFVAMLCIERINRPTLIVTPKIDLMVQWAQELEATFGVEVGMVGAGEYQYRPLTVTTYDSAYIHFERWANQYGMVVFDECHHLPSPSYQQAAQAALAPYRLGLTATPHRSDGGESLLPELIGPIVYRLEIHEVAGTHLAPYAVQRLYVELTPDEMAAYRQAREVYRQYLAQHRIDIAAPNGFRRFLFHASRTAEGIRAVRAYREQKRIIQSARGKFELLEELLMRHAQERVLIFTADNATVYAIARRFLIPPMTNQTKPRERKAILDRLQQGIYHAVVTCQVLNEGVDVPAASVGIVVGGSGSTTEIVQRLGRILRKHGEKRAILYEIVARGTAEEYTSARRRQHRAFS